MMLLSVRRAGGPNPCRRLWTAASFPSSRRAAAGTSLECGGTGWGQPFRRECERPVIVEIRWYFMQPKKPMLLVESPEADMPATRRALDNLGIDERVLWTAVPEAFTYLKGHGQQRPCVVLLSVDESGDRLATLRTIKQDDQLRSIPVVVLGPSGNRDMVDESFGLGAAGYMGKSEDSQELSATMRTLYQYWSLSELPK